MITLEQALSSGTGVERAFNCHVHPDVNASASVNIIKEVWYCYSCGAKGSTKGKTKAPSVEALEAMLRPDKTSRIYPESLLTLYKDITYWSTRFEEWICRAERLGTDPVSGEPLYPVYTPRGLVAGFARRNSGETGPKYKYPYAWAASRVLYGLPLADRYMLPGACKVLILTEGAADAIALREVGLFALSTFGSSLHHPQREWILRHAPAVILLGFDNDDAGKKGAEMSIGILSSLMHDIALGTITWPAKDPADCTPDQRTDAVMSILDQLNYNTDLAQRTAREVVEHGRKTYDTDTLRAAEVSAGG